MTGEQLKLFTDIRRPKPLPYRQYRLGVATSHLGRWEIEAFKFIEQNPDVWDLFVTFTMQLIQSGRKHYGAKAVFERIRWHTALETSDEEFKLNNNFTAYFARAFREEYPEHREFFRTRSQGGV